MECNHDCFNCAFGDCVNDEITETEAQEIESREKPKRKHGDSRSYYIRNREKILAKKKVYYQNNKEKIKAYKHKYYETHKVRHK